MLHVPGKYLEREIKQLQGHKTRPLIKVPSKQYKTREDVIKVYRHIDNIIEQYPSKHVQFSIESFVLTQPNIHYRLYEEIITKGIEYASTFSVQLPSMSALSLYEFYAINRYILLEHNTDDINLYKVYSQLDNKAIKDLESDLLFTSYKMGVHFDLHDFHEDTFSNVFQQIAKQACKFQSKTKLMMTCYDEKQLDAYDAFVNYLPYTRNIACVSAMHLDKNNLKDYKQILSE